MPNQAKARRKCHEMAPKRWPEATQSAPDGCQIDAKTRQGPQNDAQRQKYQILTDFKQIRDARSAPFSVQNLIKCLKNACQKSTPEK